jgi:HlyD family secretion protein
VKPKWKILLAFGLIALISGGVFASIKLNERGVVSVQSGFAARQDLTAVVTASGEIKPKNYITLGANTVGPSPITAILVKEGDRVRKGQVVAELQSVQANADVVAQKAAIATALADSAAAEANIAAMQDAVTTNQATLERNKAELQRTKLNLDRATELYNSKLMAKQDFDQKKAEYDTAVAAIGEAEARLAQAKSQVNQARQQTTSAQKRIAQMQAQLDRFNDVLEKYYVRAPLDGIVTDLPVRVGETVVPGVQGSAASTIMTVADMSLITAEVKVDETDIVNVKIDQPAEVTIDAMPNQTFKGHVVEIGNTAVHRPCRVHQHNGESGSQGFQSRGSDRQPPGRHSPRLVVHRQDHDGDTGTRADHSHSGFDHPAAWRPRAGQTEQRSSGGGETGSRGRKSEEGGTTRRVRDSQRPRAVHPGRDRNQRHNRHRGHEGPE